MRPSSPGCSGPARKSYVAYLDGDTSGQSVEDWQRSASSFELPLGELALSCVPVCCLPHRHVLLFLRYCPDAADPSLHAHPANHCNSMR